MQKSMIKSKLEASNFDLKCLLIFILLVGGVVTRFYFQFIEWSFNGDELDLGLGIISSDFRKLLSPLPDRQSAPPLYLLLQKLLSHIAKPYVSLKLLSFVASCVSIFLFNRLLRNRFPFYLHLILLAFFCLNPFIISNSLTLKQYALDLMLGLVAVNYFIGKRNALLTFSFFCIFCLFSNVGPFFCVSLVLYKFSKEFSKKDFIPLKGIKKVIPFLLAPVPYLLFFIWFMQQPGAENMKTFMIGYWAEAFMPTDLTFFKWIALQAQAIMLFFFSTYWVTGLVLLLLFPLGLFRTYKKRQQLFDDELLNVIVIYTLAGFVHVIFSAFRMYPFSDRLLLYLAPGIYFVLGCGIIELREYLQKLEFRKIGREGLVLFISGNIMLFFTYLPRKTNDVVGLVKFIKVTEQPVVFTLRAERLCFKWLDFTQLDLDFLQIKKVVRRNFDGSTDANFLIAVQNEKFGHKRKLTTPEPVVRDLIAKDEIRLYGKVGGFAIYEYK